MSKNFMERLPLFAYRNVFQHSWETKPKELDGVGYPTRVKSLKETLFYSGNPDLDQDYLTKMIDTEMDLYDVNISDKIAKEREHQVVKKLLTTAGENSKFKDFTAWYKDTACIDHAAMRTRIVNNGRHKIMNQYYGLDNVNIRGRILQGEKKFEVVTILPMSVLGRLPILKDLLDNPTDRSIMWVSAGPRSITLRFSSYMMDTLTYYASRMQYGNRLSQLDSSPTKEILKDILPIENEQSFSYIKPFMLMVILDAIGRKLGNGEFSEEEEGSLYSYAISYPTSFSVVFLASGYVPMPTPYTMAHGIYYTGSRIKEDRDDPEPRKLTNLVVYDRDKDFDPYVMFTESDALKAYYKEKTQEGNRNALFGVSVSGMPLEDHVAKRLLNNIFREDRTHRGRLDPAYLDRVMSQNPMDQPGFLSHLIKTYYDTDQSIEKLDVYKTEKWREAVMYLTNEDSPISQHTFRAEILRAVLEITNYMSPTGLNNTFTSHLNTSKTEIVIHTLMNFLKALAAVLESERANSMLGPLLDRYEEHNLHVPNTKLTLLDRLAYVALNNPDVDMTRINLNRLVRSNLSLEDKVIKALIGLFHYVLNSYNYTLDPLQEDKDQMMSVINYNIPILGYSRSTVHEKSYRETKQGGPLIDPFTKGILDPKSKDARPFSTSIGAVLIGPLFLKLKASPEILNPLMHKLLTLFGMMRLKGAYFMPGQDAIGPYPLYPFIIGDTIGSMLKDEGIKIWASMPIYKAEDAYDECRVLQRFFASKPIPQTSKAWDKELREFIKLISPKISAKWLKHLIARTRTTADITDEPLIVSHGRASKIYKSFNPIYKDVHFLEEAYEEMGPGSMGIVELRPIVTEPSLRNIITAHLTENTRRRFNVITTGLLLDTLVADLQMYSGPDILHNYEVLAEKFMSKRSLACELLTALSDPYMTAGNLGNLIFQYSYQLLCSNKLYGAMILSPEEINSILDSFNRYHKSVKGG